MRARRDDLVDGPARAARASAAFVEAMGVVPRLGLFAAIGSEADPAGVQARRTAYPRLDGREMELRWCAPSELNPTGRWAIPEPPAEAPVAEPLDVVLVPGLAFDGQGGRIGYGAGYYDRFIRRRRATGASTRFVGFAFEFQLVDGSLPLHEGDEILDGFVSEAGLRWFAA